jgi:GNAT superfamily N-acetyltransferase
MNSIQYIPAQTTAHLQGILRQQQRNLPAAISAQEAAEQGFVTVVHSLDDLQRLNETAPHIIGLDGERVVAYLLAMTAAARSLIPVLVPMFYMFEQAEWKGKPVSAYLYIVVGQVCVDKDYRGRGVLDACYAAYRNYYKPTYTFAITEIAVRNTRSIKAHQRIGFKEVRRYTAPDGEVWSIVAWEW